MTETSLDKPQKAIILRTGIVKWVSQEKATKLEEILAASSKHMFVNIEGMTISSQEIEAIYDMEQFNGWSKVKQGMWQCEYRNWHNKGKVECQCKSDWYKQQQQKRREAIKREEDTPMTPEQKDRFGDRMRRMNEEAALKGSDIFRRMFVKGVGKKKIRRSTIEAWEAEHGPVNVKGLNIEDDVGNQNRAEALEILE